MDFFQLQNWPFWLVSVTVGLFYGFYATKIDYLGGNRKLSPLGLIHQFFVNFPGGAVCGYLLWLLFRVNFLDEPLFGALILIFSYISMSGYMPHLVINVLISSLSLDKLIDTLISKIKPTK